MHLDQDHSLRPMTGLPFSCPDWDSLRRRRETESAVRAFRKMVLPKVRRRLGALTRTRRPGARRPVIPYDGRPLPLALEPTLERILPGRIPGREDIFVEDRSEPGLSLLVLFDTSLSMGGESWVPAAVTAAVLAQAAALGEAALIGFHSKPEYAVRFGENVKPLEAAYRVLALPFGGTTNLEAALLEGQKALAAHRRPNTHSILITDAERTAGADPRPVARRYRRLSVIHLGRRNLELSRSLAGLGRGRFRQVDGLSSLPKVLHEFLVGLTAEV